MNHYEEKARELFNKYKNLTTYQYKEYAGARYSTFEHDIDIIKQCALILVDEILTELEYIDDSAMVPYEYWVKVKQEIEKL